MIKRIMVPLDGSKLAECALAYAEELATQLPSAEIMLVSVTERVPGYRTIEDPNEPTEVRLAPEAAGKMERQATRYLDRVVKSLNEKGIRASQEVLLGYPAEEIIIYANTKSVDLIVMSSHGRTGPSRWAFGSVADKVFRSVKVPVMMIRAPGCPVTA